VRDVGDQIDIRHEVRDADGALTAATVAVTVTAPGGTTSTPTVTASSTGIYDASFTATTVGVWRWTWTVSGAVVDVAHGQVDVADPAPSTYATLPLFKATVKVTAADRDELLAQALTAAARAVDSYTGRRPAGFTLDEAATARTYEVHGRTVRTRSGWAKLLVDEIGSATGLTVEVGDGTTWTAITGYRTDPGNALADSRPITALTTPGLWGCDLVRVTARWGWPSIPDQVVQATLIQATRLYRRKDSPEGVAGQGEFGVVRLSRIDPDVQALLAHLTLPGIA
jgi:hypothetical protein